MRVNLLFFFAVFIFSILPDIYILFRLLRRKLTLLGQILYLSVSVTITLLYIVAIDSIRQQATAEAMVSLLWLNFTYAMLYMPKFLYMAIAWLDHPIRHIRQWQRCNLFSIIGVSLALLYVVIVSYETIFERFNFTYPIVEIPIKSLPASYDGYKIVQLTDLHLGNLGSNEHQIEHIVTEVNKISPDLIVLTGDLVNNFSSEFAPYYSILSKLRAKDGIYSVMGNHDYGDYSPWESQEAKQANLREIRQAEARLGFHLLDNDHVILHHKGDSIALVGVENWGDPPFPQYGDLTQALQGVDPAMCKILLSHNPIHWSQEVVPQTDIALTLSGHTHGGQFEIGGHSLAESRYKQWKGLYKQADQYLYVSNGIGYVGMPTRLFSRPEVTTLILKSSPL